MEAGSRPGCRSGLEVVPKQERSCGFALRGWRQEVSAGRSDMQRKGVVLAHREVPLELTPQCDCSDLSSFHEPLRYIAGPHLREKEVTNNKNPGRIQCNISDLSNLDPLP